MGCIKQKRARVFKQKWGSPWMCVILTYKHMYVDMFVDIFH